MLTPAAKPHRITRMSGIQVHATRSVAATAVAEREAHLGSVPAERAPLLRAAFAYESGVVRLGGLDPGE